MPTAYLHSRILLIADSQREAANEAARSIDPDPACGDTFIVGLSPTGNAPATHWVCQVRLTEDGLAKVQAAAASFPGAVIADGELTTVGVVLEAQGLKRVEE